MEQRTIARTRALAVSNPEHFVAEINDALARDEFTAFLHTSPLSADDVTASTGPLAHIPFAAKDNIGVAGLPRQGGSPAVSGAPSTANAEVVTRLLNAGALCVGTLNMHELALGTTSANAHFGFVHNPRDPERTAGGSSGGSAAAVAAGIVPFALGSDTGGSCRIPAAFAGIVGMRPTTGRYPSEGILMISPTRDTAGVLANTVSDVATVDAVITGDGPLVELSPAELRIGLPRSGFYSSLSPEVETVVEFALDKMAEAGVIFVETEVPGSHDIAEAGFFVVGYEAPRQILELLGRDKTVTTLSTDDIAALRNFALKIASPDVAGVVGHMISDPVSHKEYLGALEARAALQDSYEQALKNDDLDALVYPTVGIVAPVLGNPTVTVQGVEYPHFPYSIRNTDPGSLTGQPSLSIPIPRLEGALPVGLGVEGRRGDDRHILAVCVSIENILTGA